MGGEITRHICRNCLYFVAQSDEPQCDGICIEERVGPSARRNMIRPDFGARVVAPARKPHFTCERFEALREGPHAREVWEKGH